MPPGIIEIPPILLRLTATHLVEPNEDKVTYLALYK